MKGLNQTLKVILLLIFSITLSFLFSLVFNYWAGYPRGGDAYVHSFEVFWIAKYFPHFNWLNVWTAGMPLFIFYPAGSSLIMALISMFTGLSPELVMSVFTVIMVGFTCFFIALIVYKYSDNYLLAFLAAMISVSTPATWAINGGYSRIITLPFIVSAFYFATRLVEEPENRKNMLGVLLSLAGSFYFHTLMAVIGLSLVVVFLVISSHKFKKAITNIIRLILILMLLIAAYVVPLVHFSSPSSFKTNSAAFDLKSVEMIPLPNILGVSKLKFESLNKLDPGVLNLTPFVLPLLGLLVSLAVIYKKKLFKDRVDIFLILAALISLVYCSIKLSIFIPVYNLLSVASGLFYLMLFTVIISGRLIARFSIKLQNMFVGITSVLIIMWFSLLFGPKLFSFNELIYKKDIAPVWTKIIATLKAPNNEQFRFGTDSEADLAMVFNRFLPSYPQTRDYFTNGILNDDFNYYFVTGVWDWKNNTNETNFLLNWWSVDKFITHTESDVLDKFSDINEPSHVGGFNLYDVTQPSPIVAATNTPSFYFVGSDANYGMFFRALAQGDVNSEQAIPIKANTDMINNLELSDLNNFSAVYVYDTNLINTGGWDTLFKYVADGGRLFIDGPREEVGVLPDVYPMASIKRAQVQGVWDLSSASADLSADFSKFSEAKYQDGPWGIGTAKNLRDGAEVLLKQGSSNAVVARKIGKGEVYWSGLNLAYHIDTYKNFTEASFYKSFLYTLAGVQTVDPVSYEYKFVNPEDRSVSLSNRARGVLFKEAYFPDWHAYVDNREVKIYRAGPDFMYIPLMNTDATGELTLIYKKSITENLSVLTSIASFLILLFWSFDWWIFKHLVSRLELNISSPFKGIRDWWNKENE